jgi:hypothetical protein
VARLKHYRFGIDIGVGACRRTITLHFWRWSWELA